MWEGWEEDVPSGVDVAGAEDAGVLDAGVLVAGAELAGVELLGTELLESLVEGVLSPVGVPSSPAPQAANANSITRARINAMIFFISFFLHSD